MGSPSNACNILSRLQAPAVIVVPLVPSVGPTPPPTRVVIPLERASYACCGAHMCTCPSMPAAVSIMCSPEIASVEGPVTRSGDTPFITLGLPDFPIPAILPSRIPTSALTTPRTGSRIVTFVITRSRLPALGVHSLASPMPSRKVFPPPYTDSSP